jgi:hypothetical protein
LVSPAPTNCVGALFVHLLLNAVPGCLPCLHLPIGVVKAGRTYHCRKHDQDRPSEDRKVECELELNPDMSFLHVTHTHHAVLKSLK